MKSRPQEPILLIRYDSAERQRVTTRQRPSLRRYDTLPGRSGRHGRCDPPGQAAAHQSATAVPTWRRSSRCYSQPAKAAGDDDEMSAFSLRCKRDWQATQYLVWQRPTDGRPHLVPIWFVLHADKLYVCTTPSSVKARNIHRTLTWCWRWKMEASRSSVKAGRDLCLRRGRKLCGSL